MLSPELLRDLRELLPNDRLYSDQTDCYAYAYDNSRKIFPPDVVAFPITADEVQAITLLCNKYKTPLTPRGRGTGTAGGCLPEHGGIELSLELMLRIITIDPANRVIVA